MCLLWVPLLFAETTIIIRSVSAKRSKSTIFLGARIPIRNNFCARCNMESETIFLRPNVSDGKTELFLRVSTLSAISARTFNFHLQHAYGRIWLFSYLRRFQTKQKTHSFCSLSIRQIKNSIFISIETRGSPNALVYHMARPGLCSAHATCIFRHGTNKCRQKKTENSAFLQRIGFFFPLKFICRKCWMSEMNEGQQNLNRLFTHR